MSNDNGRGCSSAGTFVNCRRRPDVANAGWSDAVITEFGFSPGY